MKRSYPIQVEIDIDCCESCIDKDTCDHIDKCTITKNIYQSCYKEESYVKVITLISDKGTNLLDITNDIFDKKCELEKNRYVVLLITDLSSPLSYVDKKKISISDEILIFNYTTNISEEAKECINFAKDNNVVVKYKTCLHENLFSDSIKHSSNITIVKYICKDCSEIITKSYDMATRKEVKNTIGSKETQSLDNDTEIMAIMEDKKGQLRNLISGRFNFSTRAVIVPNIKENHKGKLLSIEEVLKLKDDTKLYVENSYYDDHFGEDSNIHEMKFFIDKNNQPIISVYMNRNKSYSHYIQEDFKNLRIYEWVEGDNIDGK